MARITEKRLYEKLALLQNTFPLVRFNMAYGRTAAVLGKEGHSGYEEKLSGYLSNAEMWEWLDGALTAVRLLRKDKHS